jgi:hypothetical protein
MKVLVPAAGLPGQDPPIASARLPLGKQPQIFEWICSVSRLFLSDKRFVPGFPHWLSQVGEDGGKMRFFTAYHECLHNRGQLSDLTDNRK